MSDPTTAATGRPIWISLAAGGIVLEIARRIMESKTSVIGTEGLFAEIETIIDYHAPHPERDAVGVYTPHAQEVQRSHSDPTQPLRDNV